MEQPNNIDQLFRNRIQSAEVPPPAFVWTNVERALRQRRRRFFFWLWFGLGLTGAGAWAMWANTHSAMHPVTSTVTSPVGNEKTQVTGLGAVATRDEDFERALSANKNTAAEKTVTATNVNSRGDSKRFSSKTASAADRKQRVQQLSNRTAKSREEFNFEATPIALDAQATSVNPPDAAVTLAFLPDVPYSVLTKTTPPATTFPKAKPFIFKKKTPNKNCYDFAPHAKVWLFDVYGGPSLPQRQLKAAEPIYENYLGQRRNTEQGSWAFNAGVCGSLLFGQHFLLRTGLHYEQRNEVFEYADPDFKKITITQTTHIVDNMPVTFIDTTVEYGEHYVKTYNRYGQLDVPLLAGVEFRRGRAGLSLQAGACLNVSFWKRGSTLDAQGNPASFSPDENGESPVFRKRAGWSTQASAQIFYHLRPRFRVFAEPYYSYNLRPLTLDGQPIAQRYTTWGLKLGITKIFD